MEQTNQNNPNAYRHTHNGIDSPLLESASIANALNAPQSALTPSGGAVSGGGAAVLSNSDANAINNMRTRINELEVRLKNMNLLQ